MNKTGSADINKFVGACTRGSLYSSNIEKGLPVGYFISWEYSKEAVEEVARLKRDNNIFIELVKVIDIPNLPIAKKPVVKIE